MSELAGTGVAYYREAGAGYARRRRPDPRIGAAIVEALGDARTVLNVGAGAGSYEPEGRTVVAVEPAATMLAQRPSDGRAVRAVAEALPYGERSFDAAMAVLTVHHWLDWRAGVAEMRRVARKVVVLTHDPEPPFWLFDYFPGIRERDRVRMPPVAELARALGGAEVHPVPVPHDCSDGFLGAHWRAPAAYLDPSVRSGMSGFAGVSDEELRDGLRRLESDIGSGAWRERYGTLLDLEAIDIGYRLVVSRVR